MLRAKIQTLCDYTASVLWSVLRWSGMQLSFSLQPSVNKWQNMWQLHFECGFSWLRIFALTEGTRPQQPLLIAADLEFLLFTWHPPKGLKRVNLETFRVEPRSSQVQKKAAPTEIHRFTFCCHVRCCCQQVTCWYLKPFFFFFLQVNWIFFFFRKKT